MIKVITGSMFSGKSLKVIKLLNKLNKNKIIIFKPKTDTRDNNILKSRKSKKNL